MGSESREERYFGGESLDEQARDWWRECVRGPVAEVWPDMVISTKETRGGKKSSE